MIHRPDNFALYTNENERSSVHKKKTLFEPSCEFDDAEEEEEEEMEEEQRNIEPLYGTNTLTRVWSMLIMRFEQY